MDKDLNKGSRRNKIIYGSLCVLLCILWGAGNPIIKIGLFSIPPFLMLGMRFLLAFVLFLILFRKKVFAGIHRHTIKGLVLIGFLSAVTYIFATISLGITQATIAGFLMAVAVIFTPFLSYFFLKARTDRRLFPIIVLMIIGTYFLCGGGTDFSFGIGELLALISSVTLAMVMIFTSKHIEEVGPVTMSAMQTLIIGILSMAAAFIAEYPFDLPAITNAGWMSLLYQAIFCSVITYLIQNVALKNLTAVFVSIVFCLEPLFTALFSMILLGEFLTAMGYAGGGMILVGLILASLLEEKVSGELKNSGS